MKKYKDEKTNLEHLAEKAAKIIQIKTQCTRFGVKDYSSQNGRTNQNELGREIGQLLFIVDILLENKTIRLDDLLKGKQEKRLLLSKFYNKTTAMESLRQERWSKIKNRQKQPPF